jgi:hypothetical protein
LELIATIKPSLSEVTQTEPLEPQEELIYVGAAAGNHQPDERHTPHEEISWKYLHVLLTVQEGRKVDARLHPLEFLELYQDGRVECT